MRRLGLSWAGVAPLVAALLALGPAVLHGQVGGSTEIITGRVAGPDSLPLAGARVDVTSLENRTVKHTTTRPDGRFSVLFRDGGAQYRVQVTFIGMAPATVTLVRQADEDRLVADIRMGRTAVALEAVQVRANANARGNQQPAGSSAGGMERTFPPQLLERLALTPGDLSEIAALQPGVVAVAGTDSSAKSFSVAGQPANQNNVTVDGASFLFGSVPQDAVRGVRVVTNAFDPSRGQFTGGQVATTTKSGTADLQGTMSAARQDRNLQFPAPGAPTFDQRFSQTTLTGGVGGPLPGGNAFYFASAQFDQKNDAVASLLSATGPTLANLGVNGDSAARLLGALSKQGFADPFGALSGDRTARTFSGLARVDWDFSDAHSLMVRGDWRRTSQDPTRVSPLGLRGTGGTARSTGGGAMATLTSSLGDYINEARVYGAQSHDDADALLDVPFGVVGVTSVAPAGGRSVALLQFGGNPSLPRSGSSSLVEFSDELSRLIGGHRVKLGALLNAERARSGALPNRNGTFVYNSIAEIDSGRPVQFTRSLNGRDLASGATTTGLYAGDAWRASPSLQLVYGGRLEHSSLADRPSFGTDAVASALGVRPHNWPSETRFSPRLGFTYFLGNVAGSPSGIIRGGIGEFRGKMPTQLAAVVRSESDLANAQTDLVCVGDAVPTPSWASYAADAGTIPTSCVGGAAANVSATQPNVAFFDRTFGAPRVWRASLGLNHKLFDRFATGVDALFAYGVNGTDARDVNLPSSFAGLAGEGGRALFANPADVVGATGSIPALTNRRVATIGQALLVGSGARSKTTQVVTSVVGPGFRGGFTSLAYTFSRSLDQSNGYSLGSFLPTTAGDPNALEWGTSDLERRHQLVGTVMVPVPHHLDLTFIGRMTSGMSYTPMVAGDVNGDGSRNDRAFIFAPGAASAAGGNAAAVADDIQRLIAHADSRAAACLRAQLGRIAARNSCDAPWSPSLDVQLNWDPQAAVFDDRVTLSLAASNALAGADRLLHGANIRGWGQPAFPDRNLLQVVGYDRATNAFLYQVNQHFGTPAGASAPVGAPFLLSLRARVLLGLDPAKAQLRSITGGSNGGMANIAEVKARIGQNLPYPIKTLLASEDSLHLDLAASQRTKLLELERAYEAKLDSLVTQAAEILVAAGPKPDPAVIGPRLQNNNRAAVAAVQGAVTDLKAVLTPEQWAKLPEKIRLPLAQPPAGAPRP